MAPNAEDVVNWTSLSLSEPNTYGVVCLNVDADGGELGVGSGQGDVGVGDDWAGGDMGPMSLLFVMVHMLLDIIM